ncbi:U5 small nuclear ribonucleoprotein TSSC4 isoform 1-T4 [Polymixia lowei]
MCDQDSYDARDKLSNSDVVTVPDDLILSDSDPEEEPTRVPFDSEVKELSSSSDDDDEVWISSAPEGPPSAPAPERRAVPGKPQSIFNLKGGSSSFSNRSRSIFDCLDSVAKLASSKLGQDNVIDGVFARPPPPPPLTGRKKFGQQKSQPPKQNHGGGAGGPAGRGGVPDYLVHPERWTHYSLEDVPETSDSQNSMVAQQYLLSLQQKKEQEPRGPEEKPFNPDLNQGQNTKSNCSSSQHRIIFSRTSRPGKEQTADELKAAGGREKEKGLSHLQGEEDEEEEKEEMRAAIRPLDAGQKRKWRQQDDDEEEEEEEEKSKQANPSFISFKKASRKNYRKTSEQDDD